MNICCVIDDLGSGGAQRQLVNIARRLAERGHRVEFFTYYGDDYFKPTLDEAGIPLHTHVKTGRFAVEPVRRLRRVLRSMDAQGVLAFQETPAVYAELASIGLGDVRVVAGEGSMVLGGKASAGRVLKSHLHRIAHGVVANSNFHREWLARTFPFLVGKLHTIWNGVDVELFRPDGARAASPTLRLLGIGRITVAKNIPRLIEAIATCRAQGLDVRLDWVGRVDDPAENAACLATLERVALGDAWRWLGERSDIPALLRAADALIAPSVFEGLPNVVCEALASGTPILASDVSDNPMLVQDGVRGCVFPPTDVQAIVNGVMRFARLDAATRGRMSDDCRRFALDRLSWDSCVGGYERVLATEPR